MSHCITESSEDGQGSVDVRHPPGVLLCPPQRRALLGQLHWKVKIRVVDCFSSSKRALPLSLSRLLHVFYVIFTFPISWLTLSHGGTSFLSNWVGIPKLFLSFRSKYVQPSWTCMTPLLFLASDRNLTHSVTPMTQIDFYVQHLARGHKQEARETSREWCYVTSAGADHNKAHSNPINNSSGLSNTNIFDFQLLVMSYFTIWYN